MTVVAIIYLILCCGMFYLWYRSWYWRDQAKGFEIKYKELVARLDAMEKMGQMKWHRDMETYYPGEKK